MALKPATRGRQRARKERNTGRLWDDKRQKATAPADRAALAWDAVRKQIARTPDGQERDQEWLRLADLLNDFAGHGP